MWHQTTQTQVQLDFQSPASAKEIHLQGHIPLSHQSHSLTYASHSHPMNRQCPDGKRLPWWLTQERIHLQCGRLNIGTFPSLGWEDPLEEGMATHSSVLPGESPQTEVPCGLQSMGSQRVRHDEETKHSATQETNTVPGFIRQPHPWDK